MKTITAVIIFFLGAVFTPVFGFGGEFCVDCFVVNGRLVSGYYEKDGFIIYSDDSDGYDPDAGFYELNPGVVPLEGGADLGPPVSEPKIINDIPFSAEEYPPCDDAGTGVCLGEPPK